MKKLLIGFTLVVSLLICSLVQAADKVVVVPLGGTNVYIDPRNIVSVYYNVLAGTTPVLLTVPADKHFVLTDVIGQGYLTLQENDTKKFYTRLGSVTGFTELYPTTNTISSGIVFAPGTEVRAFSHASYHSIVTISGYYY